MTADRKSPRRPFEDTRERWSLMTLHERFEQIVAIVLSFLVAVVVLIALLLWVVCA